MKIEDAVSLLKKTYSNWSDHHAPRLGASVAFYTLLSFAPLLILTVAIVAFVFDQQRAQAGLIDQARQMIGNRGADTVKSLLASAQRPSSGLIASIIAFVTLLFGASGVFAELRDALNIIWDARPTYGPGLVGMIKQRLFSFGMVLSVGFLLLVSLIISAALAILGKFFSHLLPLPAFVFGIFDLAVSFVVIAVIFALLFKFVPDRRISWMNVRVGAVGTAILFTIGKLLLGLYIGKTSVGSAYGAAGSLVAVIVWVYYSAQIFFFGAEFTRVYSDAHTSAVANDREVEAGQAKSLPETEHKKAAATAAAGRGGGEAVAASMGDGWPRLTSSSSGTAVARHSRASILSAAASVLLVVRARATKHPRSEDDTRSGARH